MKIINKLKNSKKFKALIVIKLLVKIIFIFSVIMNTSCGQKALLWEMSTDRMEVMLKGTYESEPNPSYIWNMPAVNDPLIEDDSVNYKASSIAVINTNDTIPTQFMFDIAEMRIVASDGTELKFANFRQTYSVGLNNSDPFFTSGILLQTDDITPGKTYTSLKIYFRKTLFNNATQYTSSDGGASWTYVSTSSAIFAENTVNGYDFASSMMNTYWDTLRMEAPYVNRIFPLEIPIAGGFEYSLADNRTVLEVRLLIKNFIKKYEMVTYPDGVMTLTHYWGLSDHLRRVHANELPYGHIIGVARSYVPATARTTSSITKTGVNGFIILIPSGAASADYIAQSDSNPSSISYANSDFRKLNVPNCDLPKPPNNPGSYIGPLMDYYLNYEQYKINYSSKLSTCYAAGVTGFAQYQAEWDAYNIEVSKFKLPIAAAYVTAASSVIFYNIKPGIYDAYQSTGAIPTYGMIFNNPIIQIGGPIDLR